MQQTDQRDTPRSTWLAWHWPVVLMAPALCVWLYLKFPGNALEPHLHSQDSNGAMFTGIMLLLALGIPFLIGAVWALVVLVDRLPVPRALVNALSLRTLRRWHMRVLLVMAALMLAPLLWLSAGALKNKLFGAEPANHAGMLQANVAPTALRVYVMDEANVFLPAEKAALERKLAYYERHSQHQMFLLTRTSLRGESIKAHARRVANQAGIGRAGHNDGILLLLAPNERQVRIELGKGLEALQPEAERVVREVMTPHFRKGDHYGGVVAGIDAMTQAAR